MWRWRNCLVFYSHRAAQETTTDTLTGGTKNHCPLPHALIAWSLLMHWVTTFLSPLPLQPGDSTSPTGALLSGGPRIYSSLRGLLSIRAPRCAGLWLYCLHSLVLSLPGLFDQKKSVPKHEFHKVRKLSSVYLSHWGKVLNGLAWHHSTSGIVMKRSHPENMQLWVQFYSHE